MLKCEIQFDKEKIDRVGEYSYESIQRATDELFADYDLIKTENGFYTGNGSDDDYVNFMGIIISLKKISWFMNYISKWVWYENEEDTDTGDYYIEDLKARYTR